MNRAGDAALVRSPEKTPTRFAQEGGRPGAATGPTSLLPTRRKYTRRRGGRVAPWRCRLLSLAGAWVAIAPAAAAQAWACQFRLSRAAPVSACPLPAPAPLVADIPVRPGANPASAPISLRIEFAPPSGAAIRLASVSLYPVDRPQAFAVRLPRKPGRLTIALIPDPRPVTIDVGPIVWRYAEP
jgi:hypothetical protein